MPRSSSRWCRSLLPCRRARWPSRGARASTARSPSPRSPPQSKNWSNIRVRLQYSGPRIAQSGILESDPYIRLGEVLHQRGARFRGDRIELVAVVRMVDADGEADAVLE